VEYFILGFLCLLGVGVIFHFIFEPEHWESLPKGKAEWRQKNTKSLGNFLFCSLNIACFILFLYSFSNGLYLIGGTYSSICSIFYISTECIRFPPVMHLISLEEGFIYLGLTINFGLLTWLSSKGVQKADILREDAGINLMLLQKKRYLKKYGFSDDFIEKLP